MGSAVAASASTCAGTTLRSRISFLFPEASLGCPRAPRQDAHAGASGIVRRCGHSIWRRGASIVARFWTFEDRPLDADFVAGRVRDEVDLRGRVVPPETDGYRVVNAEGDFLPGLVVDRFGEVLVVQSTTEGTARARPLWLPPLLEAFPGATAVSYTHLRAHETR